jgi:hypothetical protein
MQHTIIEIPEGEHKDKTYLVTNPDYLTLEQDEEVLFQITDGGNTLETRDGIIVGHYVPALRTH